MDSRQETTAGRDAGIPAAVTTPDRVETRLGTLDFTDGMPSPDTLTRVYDHLDFVHAFDAFVNALQGVNTHAMRRGYLEAGVGDNEFLIFSELIDARTLYLMPNADTVYVGGFIDLSAGPMVLETPAGLLGAVNDYWGAWVIDLGGPGPDRGVGGRYLLVPPGYDGPLPEGGFFVARPRTLRVMMFARVFLQDGDPAPADRLLCGSLKAYRYQAGAVGTSFAAFLRGEARLGAVTPPSATVFHHTSGKAMNTIMPNDSTFYDYLDEVVQQEPAGSLDPELMGAIAAIGIVKGRPFAPTHG